MSNSFCANNIFFHALGNKNAGGLIENLKIGGIIGK